MKVTSMAKIGSAVVEKPDIKDYLDHRQFIRDYLAFMQKEDAKYSQRWLAKKAGLKSPHLLSMVISGKRNLSRENSKALALAMKLDKNEIEYFQILGELSQSENEVSRTEIMDRLQTSFREGLFSQISDAGAEVLREWFVPAIREVVELEGFQEEKIPEYFDISMESACDAVRLLLDLGFLKREDGQLKRSEPSIHNNGRLPPMLVSRFQLQMMQKAFAAATLPIDKRYFECLTVSISEELLPDLMQAIKRFYREVDALSEASSRRNAVYQLNMQLFPLTRCSE